ncbi:prepilin-type N-terminal cleavage/methylation domain-containing protein [Nitrosococcus wardiae]|uniref:Prepilin-type N-terminal cleavage/methylation domain-containing protein n=1 Tax=Nitrosococcus wardiae TaxID=1814290 RepID=A0A4P7BWE4_9GAMM|nr:prepilin-type N-terminal cleavage/methylation domain-containing protein [Nitrosococcus wardiae]QBQ53539.1 prepilin-type N-terminal cleavage/methylation domain-containing protein [Nitrosococcus wardiae]
MSPRWSLWRHGAGSKAPHSCQGFTLVELLIAMTLVGMMLVILFSGLRLATRSWEAAEQKLEVVEKQRVIEGLFRRQIREQKLLFFNDPEQGQTMTFAGTAEAMQFVAPLLTRLGLGGLYWITFEVVKEGGESHLMMSWRPYRPEGQETTGREREVLLEAVEEIAFSYFGKKAVGEAPEWYERWEDTQRPPQLVRLQVRTQEAEWPELIAGIQSSPPDGQGRGFGRRFRVDFGPGPAGQ